MKTKIDFRKLLCGEYCIDEELEMINWFLNTGLQGEYEIQRGWNRSGINQLIYGYSANNENYNAPPFPIDGDMRSFLMAIFVRAIVSGTSSDMKGEIAEWRSKNKIAIDKYRYFDFPFSKRNDPNPGRHNVRYFLWRISDCKGKGLKKKYAHPDFPYRTKPRIINIHLSTCGEGYFVSIEFSFFEFNYEPGWTEQIAIQKKGEYIGDFLARAYKKLKAITVNTVANKRLDFEVQNNFKTYSEKSCFNCVWLESGKTFICDLMKRHRGVKDFEITHPQNHCCNEWRFSDSKNQVQERIKK